MTLTENLCKKIVTGLRVLSLQQNHICCSVPLWNSFSEVSDVLSPGLQSSFLPPKKLSTFMLCIFESQHCDLIFHAFSWFRSVTQSCPTLCNPMNRSLPGLPVHHQLLEFTQTHSHQVRMSSNHLILCHPLLLLPPIPPSIRVFSNESTVRMR